VIYSIFKTRYFLMARPGICILAFHF